MNWQGAPLQRIKTEIGIALTEGSVLKYTK